MFRVTIVHKLHFTHDLFPDIQIGIYMDDLQEITCVNKPESQLQNT
jgi:hypothetical protein